MTNKGTSTEVGAVKVADKRISVGLSYDMESIRLGDRVTIAEVYRSHYQAYPVCSEVGVVIDMWYRMALVDYNGDVRHVMPQTLKIVGSGV